jgi:hypothetical protein
MTEPPSLIREIDYLLAARKEIAAEGPCFRIVHARRVAGNESSPCCTGCIPGEEILGVWLVHRGRSYQLAFSRAEAGLVDYLSRRRMMQTATQIERGIHTDPFHQWQCTRRRKSGGREARYHRTTIRIYVRRVRLALADVFHDSGLSIDPASVMVIQPTFSNEVMYRFTARTECVHISRA